MNPWLEWALLAVVVVLVCLPPKWDPAIRWKEYNERKRLEREHKFVFRGREWDDREWEPIYDQMGDTPPFVDMGPDYVWVPDRGEIVDVRRRIK